MKKNFLVPAMVLAGLMLCAVAVYAQRPGGPEGGFIRADRILSTLDGNSDGTISASELDNATAVLRQLDKNADGKLTGEEVRPNFPGGRGFGGTGGNTGNSSDEMVRTLMEFDRNSDGQLSKDEVPERMQGLFERSDADKNGLLTREELKASVEAQSNVGAGVGRGRPSEDRMGERGGKPEEPGGPGMRSPAMAALDADGDGIISDAELNNAPAALKKLDKNNDGNLTEEEVRPNFGGRRGPGGPGGRNPEEMINHLFEENDKNNDGKLSKDELPERMLGLLERADSDKDGFLTKEEMKAFFESQGSGFGPGRPGDGEGRPRRQRP